MNLPYKCKHVLILTGEPSGDLHGGHLIREIRKLNPDIYISGIGGPCLEEEQVDLFYSIDKLSVMGVTEVLMQIGQIKQAFDCFKQKLRTHLPDLIIAVDYPGFNLKAIQYAKAHYPVKVLYYITPKVWAWKKSRLRIIKQFVDHAALILPFEEKIFQKAGIAHTYVGNPLMDNYPDTLSRPFQRMNHHMPDTERGGVVIGLLPGSRKTEVSSLLPTMVTTARQLNRQLDNVTFLISKAGSIRERFLKTHANGFFSEPGVTICEGPVKEVLLKSHMVIAASGTVTLEAALCCVPTIIVYRMSPISYLLARFFVQVKYAGLANLIVDEEVMPELLQSDATPEKITTKALEILDNLPYYEKRLFNVRKRLGRPGASKRAGHIALNMLRLKDLEFNLTKEYKTD